MPNCSASKTDFSLFLDQQKRFAEALHEYDPSIWFPLLRGGFKEDQPGNWFICFVPSVWGRWKTNYGVHFDFIYARPSSKLPERFRLAIGVESPLDKQHRQTFKEEVISRINARSISHSGFVLVAQDRKKLLEVDPIPFGPESWRIALDRYIALRPVVHVIGEVSKEYLDSGAFDCPIEFS
jgi:hypothetical protein